MFIKDFEKYIVIKTEDTVKLSRMDSSFLERALSAVRVERLKQYKPERKYVVVSDSDPELFKKVWNLIKESEKDNEAKQSTVT